MLNTSAVIITNETSSKAWTRATVVIGKMAKFTFLAMLATKLFNITKLSVVLLQQVKENS